MSVNSDRDRAATIAGMLGMSSEMEEHFYKLIKAVEKSDAEWLAAVKMFQAAEPSFTDDHANMVRTFWQAQG
ncbi:hypothetical protein [Devosia sp. MC521]|uniref:hypothetical protein n=1 Tax=Devosia sp. MC521 TaxID=2759954 RepID=UPI0015FAD42D|nr:hypothetical protein [Devosia sp. MC521]MBJ6987279.1 hypothetical protein [Devosia sp. MC521]QMW62887.1 hypothetical protein H4N61_00500 [Devosia sp. MC521]